MGFTKHQTRGGNKMMALLQRLQEPALVAWFQRKCGVDHAPPSTGKIENGVASKVGKLTNGNNNGTVYQLRSRTVKHALNGRREIQDGDDSDSSASSRSDIASDTSKSLDSDNNILDYEVSNRFFYYLFCMGAGIGNEIFYVLFFPSWFWNVDGFVCRRLILIWAFIMYIGQATKDIVRLPRPPSPPVVKLEKRYELEYGMPSTHAMIGAAFPFSLLMLTWNRYVYMYKCAAAGSFLWCSLVCLSRLYMGMHSVLDILFGLLYAAVLVPILWPFLDAIDDFTLYHPYSPFIVPGVLLLAAIFYPTIDKWSTARGDTTLILGVAAGVAVASWLNIQQDIYHNQGGEQPYFVKTPDTLWISHMECRMILGAVILLGTRFVMKGLTYHLICYILKVDRKCFQARQRLIVELPYKFITYFVIAFNVVYTAPAIFRYLGIEKEVIFTEV